MCAPKARACLPSVLMALLAIIVFTRILYWPITLLLNECRSAQITFHLLPSMAAGDLEQPVVSEVEVVVELLILR